MKLTGACRVGGSSFKATGALTTLTPLVERSGRLRFVKFTMTCMVRRMQGRGRYSDHGKDEPVALTVRA
jgi:hypothetical protein